MLPNFVPAISTLQSTQLDIKRFAQTVGMLAGRDHAGDRRLENRLC
jgi:hypothetical protein